MEFFQIYMSVGIVVTALSYRFVVSLETRHAISMVVYESNEGDVNRIICECADYRLTIATYISQLPYLLD
jgi:hypothetical protein